MSLLRRRIMMEYGKSIFGGEVFSGTFTIENNICSTNYGTWSNVPVANIGVIVPWEEYMVLLFRISSTSPAKNKTLGMSLNENNSGNGNFSVSNVRNRGLTQDSSNLVGIWQTDRTPIIDGTLYVNRFNSEFYFNAGDVYQYFVFEKTWEMEN